MIQHSTLLVLYNNSAEPEKIVIDCNQIADFNLGNELKNIDFEPDEKVIDNLILFLKNND